MNTAACSDPRIQEVRVTEDEIIAHPADGRVIGVSLAWSWRLSEAAPAQRANFRLIGTGQGIHWPDIDENLSVEGMLHGVPARRPKACTAAASRKAPHLSHPSASHAHAQESRAADALAGHEKPCPFLSGRNPGRESPAVLAPHKREIKKGTRRPGEPVRASGQEVNLPAAAANPSLDAGQSNTNTFPLELM